MSQFTYDRKDVIYTLPFNPTEEGWEYKHCNCQSVKFEKKTETGKIGLSVFPDKKRFEYTIFENKGTSTHHKGTKYIENYPVNQEGFKMIIQQEGI